MFTFQLISQSATSLLETQNIVSISFTDLTTEPSLFHKHNETEILFPSGGEGNLLSQYQNVRLVPGRLYIVNPQTSHTERTNSTLQYYVVQLKNVSLTHCTNSLSEFPLSKEQFSVLESLLSMAKTELERKANYSEKIAYLYLANFYYQVKRILSGQNQKLTKTNNKIASSELVNEVKKYIADNCGLDLKILQVAKHFAVSSNYLTLKFKQETGKTPQQFLLESRIQTGKYLLLTSDYNVTQIASLCGFNSSAHFAEMFKKHESVSPTEYRIKHRKQTPTRN